MSQSCIPLPFGGPIARWSVGQAPSIFAITFGSLILINGPPVSPWIDRRYSQEAEIIMKRSVLGKLFLATVVVSFGMFGSFDQSPNEGLSLSFGKAEARVGRPLTPVSVAGVARRTTRRAVVRGAAVGAAAAGTACVRVLVNGAYVCR
jgi:hypothetical protein